MVVLIKSNPIVAKAPDIKEKSGENFMHFDVLVNKIICGNTVEVMRKIRDGSVDLVITSPPYNLKNSTGNGMKDGRGGKWANAALQKGYSHHSDCMPHDEYVNWQRECLTEMLRIIPEDGAIFYNHKWRVQGGLLQDRQDIVTGFPVRQIIIWRRKGGFNFNPGYFVPTYEVIEENNLPIPNAAEWELKAQRIDTTSLCTLFHTEPSPQAIRFVPKVLLPNYGWAHKEDGMKYPKGEMSFRQTINGLSRSDRGFMVKVDRTEKKVLISFDAGSVDIRHAKWLESVKKRAGLGELDPQPYWGFDDLEHKAGTKLHNSFYVQAEVKTVRRKEFYKYTKVMMLQKFDFDGFLKAIEDAKILVDFDARSGHNHGTKFRIRQDIWPTLHEKVTVII